MNRKNKKKIQELILEKFKKKNKEKDEINQDIHPGFMRDPQFRGYPVVELFSKDGKLLKTVKGENHVSVYSTRFYGSRPLYLQGVSANERHKNNIPQFDTKNNIRIYAVKENLSGRESKFGVSGEIPADKITAWSTFDTAYSGEDMTRGTLNTTETSEGVWTKIVGEEASFFKPIQRNTYVSDWSMERGNGVIQELYLNYKDGTAFNLETFSFFDENTFAYKAKVPFFVPLGFVNNKTNQKNLEENTMVLFGSENRDYRNSVQSKFYLVSYRNGLKEKNTATRVAAIEGLNSYLNDSYGFSTTGFDGTLGKPLIFDVVPATSVAVREINITTDTGNYNTFNTATGAVGNTFNLSLSQTPVTSSDKVAGIQYTGQYIYLIVASGSIGSNSKTFYIIKYDKTTKGYISHESTGVQATVAYAGYTNTSLIFNGETIESLLVLSNGINTSGTKDIYGADSFYEIRKAGSTYYPAKLFRFGQYIQENDFRLYSLRQISINSRALFRISKPNTPNTTNVSLEMGLFIQNTSLAHFILPEPILKTADQVMRITWVLDYYPNTLYGWFWDVLPD